MPARFAGIVTAPKNMTVHAQVIWGAQRLALEIKKHATPICEIPGLPDWHTVRGKHLLQQDSLNELAEHIANLVATTV